MAAIRTPLNNYHLADGSTLSVNANTALFSLIGNTFGGDGRTTFALPDLRGKVVIGAGTAADGTVYPLGNTGGQRQLTLTTAQMPMHVHSFSTPVDLSKVTASTNLAQVTGGQSTTALGGVNFSGSGAALTLKGSSGNGSVTTASGGALATANGPSSKIYNSSAPDVAMMAGSISGTVSGTLSGTAPTTLAGIAPTTLAGPASVTGNTNVAGNSMPIAMMPPYLALYYYINTQGIYPSFGN